MKKQIIAIVGPTCSGKSDLAVEVALRLGGEVVSADSRQVYRGLDIGTGKATPEEMRGVTHHLIDVANPSETFTVRTFQRLAYEAIDGILARGAPPIIAGGTGFYVQSIVDGLVLPTVPPNPKLREDLANQSLEELWKTLRREDTERAKTIDRSNRRRLERAIEIAYAIGPISGLERRPRYEVLQIGLDVPREELYQKIHDRLMARVDAGMFEEVSRLHADGLSVARMEELGLEYKYVARYIRGEIDRNQCLQELESAIKRYAKRQLTWFKKDARIRWFHPSHTDEIFNEIDLFLR